jgi:type I restriction enzyme, S subunit
MSSERPAPATPEHWRWLRVAEVGEVVTGRTPPTKNPSFFGGDIPFVTPVDVGSGNKINSAARTLTAEGASYARIVPAESVLVTCIGNIGRVGLATAPCATNQQINAVIPSGGAVAGRFLLYAMLAPGFQEQLLRSATTTTVALVNKARFSRLQIPIPPLDEQRRIVAAIEAQFSRLDAGTAYLSRARRNLGRRRASILAAAIGGNLSIEIAPSHTGESLLHSEGIEPLSDGDLPAIPAHWSWARLGDLLALLKNGVFVSRPGTDPASGPAILRISAVRPMVLDVDDVRYAHGDDQKWSGSYLNVGDLLFTRYSGNPQYTGACARVTRLPRPTLHPDKLIRAVVRSTVADPAFLELAVSAGASRAAIRARIKTTAGQTGISGSDLRSVPVPVPPIEEQRAIADVAAAEASVADRIEAILEGVGAKSDRLRRATLDRAFSGTLLRGPNATTATRAGTHPS